jgi:hypothetical protein
MLDDMRVVVVTPAGRKRYLEILFKYIEKLRPVVDEYRLWVNTFNTDDIAYMEQYQKENSDYVTLEYLPSNISYADNLTIHHFFRNCKDPNTIYVRFDDDVVFLDNIDKFTEYLKFRRDNPQYFLVYANIINNAICSHLHQRIGALAIDNGISGYECMDEVGWKNGDFTKHIHHTFFTKLFNYSSFYMNNWLLYKYERVSINGISWLGSYFSIFNGEVDKDEEKFLSCDKPKEVKKMNIIYGGFLCVHYAFGPQREIVDNDPFILTTYKSISSILIKPIPINRKL